MRNRGRTVAEKRGYAVLDVKSAKEVAQTWVERECLENVIGFGLPEVDDRYHVWRVPLLSVTTSEQIGEVVIDARSSLVLEGKSTAPSVLE